MWLRNTSRYDTDEVRRLVGIAAEGFDLTRTCVNIKNSRSTFRGTAYRKVPYISNAPRTSRRLVVIAIGIPQAFPAPNYSVRTGIPWAGKAAPRIDYNNWREALVGVAAHEFNHLRQFDLGGVCSEVRCEKAAERALARYRASQKEQYVANH